MLQVNLVVAGRFGLLNLMVSYAPVVIHTKMQNTVVVDPARMLN